MLVNLVTNAIELLGATGGRTRPLSQSRARRITIHSASLDGQGVQLDVSDTGAGIAADELDHIFDPFYTTKASGTGLGLSLCRTIAEDHHGRVWASQGEECGSIFHLWLPYSLSAIDEISKTRSPAA